MARIQALGLTRQLALAMAITLASCSRGPARIVVGSKNFTEQLVLGEIIAGQIERTLHQPVLRKLNLGGTLLAHQALVAGSIDVYPEYSGTALTAILKHPPSSNPAQVFEHISREYSGQWHLRWMRPFGFDDTFAIVIRGDTARRSALTTISDAARRPQPWRLGVGYEFLQRPDGFRGLVSTYGLRVDGQPVSMDLGLLYRALDGKQVEMVAGNATDGQLGLMDVAVLLDDKHYFPPYQCAAVVREAALAAHPGLGAALAELSGKINDKEMRRLNHEVQGQHRRPADVADEFLKRLTGR